MTAPDRPDCLWVDATHGAAGDMFLGALLDAGAPAGLIRRDLQNLPVEDIELRVEPVRRHGLRATRARVVVAESAQHRTLRDVIAVFAAAGLPTPVTDFAGSVFRLLASAEADVHGVAVDEVQFHEVGALDALADVAGCALALNALGALGGGMRRVVSPIAVGGGTANTAHGALPVPVPAVLSLAGRHGAPVVGGWQGGELCTPTGAALLTALADGWGPLPAVTVHGVGTGAGTADFADHPNVLRVVTGKAAPPVAGEWSESEMLVVEATIDDLDPRVWPSVLDEVHAAGAVDAWTTSVHMRKGRTGRVLSALATPETADSVLHAIMLHTTTLGGRLHPVRRRSLPRTEVVVDVGGCPVRVKRGILDASVVTVQPEYAEVVAAARRLHQPVRAVLERVRRAADEQSREYGTDI